MQLRKIDVAVRVGVMSSYIVLAGIASDIFDGRNVISNARPLCICKQLRFCNEDIYPPTTDD